MSSLAVVRFDTRILVIQLTQLIVWLRRYVKMRNRQTLPSVPIYRNRLPLYDVGINIQSPKYDTSDHKKKVYWRNINYNYTMSHLLKS